MKKVDQQMLKEYTTTNNSLKSNTKKILVIITQAKPKNSFTKITYKTFKKKKLVNLIKTKGKLE